MKIIFNIFVMYFLFSIMNINANEADEKLLHIINQEIQTIEKNPYRSEELKHRIFELNLEELKINRKIEFEQFEKLSIKEKKAKTHDDIYKKSKQFFHEIHQYGLNLISQYPSYLKVPDIYYSLAITSREYENSVHTEKYLLEALKSKNISPSIAYRSHLGLAEYYYNAKRYHEAIIHYQVVINNKKDEWLSKHLYNMAWCQLKELNFTEAIELIKQSFNLSKNKKYISIDDQIINSIGLFFIQAERYQEAVSFYKKNASPSSPHLLNLVNFSLAKNDSKIIDFFLKEALIEAKNDDKKASNFYFEVKVKIKELEIYQNLKKEHLFLNTIESLVALKKRNAFFLPDDLSNVINTIREHASNIQKNIVLKKLQSDYVQALFYFDSLIILDHINTPLYQFYQGETALSILDYKKAITFYKKTITNSKKDFLDTNITQNAFNALFYSLNLDKSKNQNKNYIFAFKNFLLKFPNDLKAPTYYQKLFNLYLEKKYSNLANNVLVNYHYYFPKDEKIHREMLGQLLELAIVQKNTDRVNDWVTMIEKGYLNFSNDFVQKSLVSLSDLLFYKYQQFYKEHKTKEAIKGLTDIYEKPKYPSKIKADAAYSLSTIFLDANKDEEAYDWLLKSKKLYLPTDIEKMGELYYHQIITFQLLQNNEVVLEESKYFINFYCQKDTDLKSRFYDLYITELMLTTSPHEIIGHIHNYKKCNVPDKDLVITHQKVLSFFLRFDDIETSNQLYLDLNNDNIYGQFYTHLLIEKFETSLNPTVKMAIKKILESNQNAENYLHKTNEIDIFNNYLKSIEFNPKLYTKFNEEVFNHDLDQLLLQLDGVQNRVRELIKNSTPHQKILIFKNLSTPFKRISKALFDFSPKGLATNYEKGLKNEMRHISETLNSKSLIFDKEYQTFLGHFENFFLDKSYDILNLSEKNNTLENSLFFHLPELYTNTLDFKKNDGIKK